MSDTTPDIQDDYKLPHDAFFKATFAMQDFAKAFVKHILPKKLVAKLNIEKLTVEKLEFRDDLFRGLFPDIVYRVPIKGVRGSVCVHTVIEHKAQNDQMAIFQLSRYVMQLCDHEVRTAKEQKKLNRRFRLSPIIPILLHQGLSAFTGPTQLADMFYPVEGTERYLPKLQAVLVDLTKIDEKRLPRDPETPELYVVLLIMKVIFSKDRATLLSKWQEILDELKPYSEMPKYRRLIRLFWYYTGYNTTKLTETDYKEIEADIRKNTGDDTMPTLAQIFTKKGEAKGKADGIIRTLTKRIAQPSEKLEEKLLALTNLEQLDQLFDLALDCQSLDEFENLLAQVTM